MLTPGIYYNNRNSVRQLLKILPGTAIYAKDNNLVPLTTNDLLYTRREPGLKASLHHQVKIYIDNVLMATVPVLDDTGLYQYTSTAPGTVFEVKSVFVGPSPALPDRVESLRFPAVAKTVTYVNHRPSLNIGDQVQIYVEGVLTATAPILNAAGLYVCEFTPPRTRTFTVRSVYPNLQYEDQIFQTVNLHTLLAAFGEHYAEFKRTSAISLSNLFSYYLAEGILRGQADELAFNRFGDLAGFQRPFDWPFDRYADAVGGSSISAKPGLLPTFRKGSTTGAVKDVVKSITGYDMLDSDFTLLQQTRWRLPSTWRYRYTNAPGPVLWNADGAKHVSGIAPSTYIPAGTYGLKYSINGLPPNGFTFSVELTSGEDIAAYIQTEIYGDPMLTLATLKATVVFDGSRYTITSGEGGPTSNVEILTWDGPGLDAAPLLKLGFANGGDFIPSNSKDTYFLAGSVNNLASPIAVLESDTRRAFTLLLNINHNGFYVADGEPIVKSDTPVPTAYNNFGSYSSMDQLQYTWINPWTDILYPVPSDLQSLSFVVPAVPSNTYPLAVAPSAGSVNVYINGVYLGPDDYSLVGTDVVLTPAVVATLVAGMVVSITFFTSGPVWQAETSYQQLDSYVVLLERDAIATGMRIEVNGIPIPAGEFVLSTPRRIYINHTGLLNGDTITVRYNSYTPVVYGSWQHFENFTANTALVQLSNPVIPSSLQVYLNGVLQDPYIGSYVFTSPSTVVLTSIPIPGDTVQVVYYIAGMADFVNAAADYAVATPPAFTAVGPIIQTSPRLFINGLHEPSATFTFSLDGMTVTPVYGTLGLIDGDRVHVIYELEWENGSNLTVTQGTTEYSQGTHFSVDYANGRILWHTGMPAPDLHTSYLARYTYFPREQVQAMLDLIKPATIRLFPVFTITPAGLSFKPFFWNSAVNPTGIVVL